MQGRWIKSHKVVDFPMKNFDPTKYLADVPRNTLNLVNSGIKDEKSDLFPPQDFHQHRLKSGVNPFKLDYNLYAVIVSYWLPY